MTYGTKSTENRRKKHIRPGNGLWIGKLGLAGFADRPGPGMVRPVISSFKDRNTRRSFEGHRVATFLGFADHAARRLTLLASAKSLGDLAALPGNRLESLRGDGAGQCSIRINAQWRICFRWEPDGSCGVEIVDYHR